MRQRQRHFKPKLLAVTATMAMAMAMAMAMLASASCLAQSDSTMRRAFVPSNPPVAGNGGGAAGFSQIYVAVNLLSQNLYGSMRLSASPSVGYGPFVVAVKEP